MQQNEYLLISMGQWDESASMAEIQEAIDRFYVWYEKGLSEGTFKKGSRLGNEGKRVSRRGITDGPFAEAKELIGGYWFIVASSLAEAARIAADNPCMKYGLSCEVRPLESERARAAAVTSETPAAWRAGEA